jgi:hypothetical protein
MRTEIHGGAEDGYGPVADAFAMNFVLRAELAPADAEREVGFGYIYNRMGGIGDERSGALVAALGACLRA